jgi:hypothetical protein
VTTDPPQGPFDNIATATAILEQVVLCDSIALATARERARCAWWARAFSAHPNTDAAVLRIERGDPKP